MSPCPAHIPDRAAGCCRRVYRLPLGAHADSRTSSGRDDSASAPTLSNEQQCTTGTPSRSCCGPQALAAAQPHQQKLILHPWQVDRHCFVWQTQILTPDVQSCLAAVTAMKGQAKDGRQWKKNGRVGRLSKAFSFGVHASQDGVTGHIHTQLAGGWLRRGCAVRWLACRGCDEVARCNVQVAAAAHGSFGAQATRLPWMSMTNLQCKPLGPDAAR